MIACVSPGYSHADHTLNTIRYAARLKECYEDKHEKEEEKGKQFGKRKATTSGDTKREKVKERES